MTHIDPIYESQDVNYLPEAEVSRDILNKKRYIKFTFAGPDGVILTYEKNDCIYPYVQDLSFQYIADFFITRKWPNEQDGYVPVVQEIAGRKSDACLDAIMVFHNLVEQQAVSILAKCCVENSQLSAVVISAAAEAANKYEENGKKQWQKTRRRLRDHEKRGKSLWADYCGILMDYQLINLCSFEYADA